MMIMTMTIMKKRSKIAVAIKVIVLNFALTEFGVSLADLVGLHMADRAILEILNTSLIMASIKFVYKVSLVH
jgi:hypothetical protein